MSVLEIRGGVPRVFRASIDTTGRKHRFSFTSKWLKLRVAINPCRVYFTKEDFDADEGYVVVPVPSAQAPHGEWEGPVEADEIWLRGDGGSSDVELVAFQRRG